MSKKWLFLETCEWLHHWNHLFYVIVVEDRYKAQLVYKITTHRSSSPIAPLDYIIYENYHIYEENNVQDFDILL